MQIEFGEWELMVLKVSNHEHESGCWQGIRDSRSRHGQRYVAERTAGLVLCKRTTKSSSKVLAGASQSLHSSSSHVSKVPLVNYLHNKESQHLALTDDIVMPMHTVSTRKPDKLHVLHSGSY